MIKKTIKFVDFDGKEKEKVAYFHLNRVELMDMQMSTEGGYAEHIQKIVDAKDSKELYFTFKNLILKSYGIKTEDGEFRKSSASTEAFANSEAFAELLMTLLANTEEASEFINGIIPKVPADHKAAEK